MTGRSIDIALTQVEAGEKTEIVYENTCTLSSEPELCFNYATTDELKKWGFSEGCFSCLSKDKKDVIIQVITNYKDIDGARKAYDADARYLKQNGYGKPLIAKKIGDTSLVLKKIDTDGFTYNLLFVKNNVFAGISAKYKKDSPQNLDHLTGFAEKIEKKIVGAGIQKTADERK
ncbi:MAG: hypothetical protein OIN87_10605 [Candidatus Methanoperedens sp.]|nr:hypothetical protein [Candidatus Methanoperedens sp.]